jgi:iron-sulfur cluster assembly accessory protein
MINVSTTAASKINELLAEEGKAGSGLRVFVQGGGCSGFQYGLMIEESGGAGDQVFESNGVKLFVDPVSVSYLKGAEVDFVDTVTGGGFTIKNPNATSTCGCGSSFSVAGEGAPAGMPLVVVRDVRFQITSRWFQPAEARRGANAPASGSRSSTCSSARRGTSAPTIWSI